MGLQALLQQELGSEPLNERSFAEVIQRVLTLCGSDASLADPLSLKALWCELTKDCAVLSRRVEPHVAAEVFLQDVREGGAARRSPCTSQLEPLLGDGGLPFVPPNEEELTVNDTVNDQASLLEALRFSFAADKRTLPELLEAVLRKSGGSVGGSLTEQDFKAFAAAFAGGQPIVPRNSNGDGSELCEMTTDVNAKALFRDMAIASPDGSMLLSLDIFFAEVCPEKASESKRKVSKARQSLLCDLSTAAQSKGPLEFESKLLTEQQFGQAVQRILAHRPEPFALKALWRSALHGCSCGTVVSVAEFLDLLSISQHLPSKDKSMSLDYSDLESSALEVTQDGLLDETITPLSSPMPKSLPRMESNEENRNLVAKRKSLEELEFAAGSVYALLDPFDLETESLEMEERRGRRLSSTATAAKRRASGEFAFTSALQSCEGQRRSWSSKEPPTFERDAGEGNAEVLQNESAANHSADGVVEGLDKVVHVIEEKPTIADHWLELAVLLEESATVCVMGAAYSRKDLYIKAIELDPSLAGAYSDLGVVVSSLSGDLRQVELHGRPFTEKDLYVHAIELDALCAKAYLNLSDIMGIAETVWIEGRQWSRAEVRMQGGRLERRPVPTDATCTDMCDGSHETHIETIHYSRKVHKETIHYSHQQRQSGVEAFAGCDMDSGSPAEVVVDSTGSDLLTNLSSAGQDDDDDIKFSAAARTTHATAHSPTPKQA
eukprot:3580454-Amphidinium_carterae.1